MAKRKAGYTISAVAEMYEVHPQTLRSWEREGLLRPARSRGNTRLYSEENLEQLELILTLTREMGVNLAGVEVILNMRERMQRMQLEVESLLGYLQTHFDIDPDLFSGRMREALIRFPGAGLMRVRDEKRAD